MNNIMKNNANLIEYIPKREIYTQSQIFKHTYNKINFDDVTPKVKEISISMEYNKKKLELKLDEIFKNSLNMYFSPLDFETKIKKNLC